MNAMRQSARYAVWLFAALASAVPAARCQTVDPLNILSSPAGTKTAVRFFLSTGRRFDFPLVFHVVPPDDVRLDTMPALREGRIAYVTQPEMRLLLKGLSGLGLKWRETPNIVPLGPGFPGPEIHYALEITVLSIRGTATGEFALSRVCGTLVPLQSSLRRPRARWELQHFLTQCGCKVTGYDPNAFSFRGQKSVW
jgi:hypothetical protein